MMVLEKTEDLMVVGPLYFLIIKVSTMASSFKGDVMATGSPVPI